MSGAIFVVRNGRRSGAGAVRFALFGFGRRIIDSQVRITALLSPLDGLDFRVDIHGVFILLFLFDFLSRFLSFDIGGILSGSFRFGFLGSLFFQGFFTSLSLFSFSFESGGGGGGGFVSVLAGNFGCLFRLLQLFRLLFGFFLFLLRFDFDLCGCSLVFQPAVFTLGQSFFL
ncbi:hypothetical protein AA313_de0204541 [Arthrobotrys entomopaga]|nr:hypothetical protein AA313_de0204541 [Arthrobotrys entomopaga]